MLTCHQGSELVVARLGIGGVPPSGLCTLENDSLSSQRYLIHLIQHLHAVAYPRLLKVNTDTVSTGHGN